ncbi:MAG: hypothetical protein FD130_1146, partial [Halothiobacillaceae bacterium]
MKVARILRLVVGACGVMLLWPSLAPAVERYDEPPLWLRLLDLRMGE